MRLKKDKNIEEVKIKHIAFIMDGNGRWAKKRGLPREYGHRKGAQTFKTVMEYCGDIGISAITFYVFSTENWKRPQSEVDALMNGASAKEVIAMNQNETSKVNSLIITEEEAQAKIEKLNSKQEETLESQSQTITEQMIDRDDFKTKE